MAGVLATLVQDCQRRRIGAGAAEGREIGVHDLPRLAHDGRQDVGELLPGEQAGRHGREGLEPFLTLAPDFANARVGNGLADLCAERAQLQVVLCGERRRSRVTAQIEHAEHPAVDADRESQQGAAHRLGPERVSIVEVNHLRRRRARRMIVIRAVSHDLAQLAVRTNQGEGSPIRTDELRGRSDESLDHSGDVHLRCHCGDGTEEVREPIVGSPDRDRSRGHITAGGLAGPSPMAPPPPAI